MQTIFILFWISIFLTVLTGVLMTWSERQIALNKPGLQKNFGIRLQFARSKNHLVEMLEGIPPSGKSALGFNLGIDYAYMIGFY
ncbi:MAG: hypothetical protein C5B52_14325 [Bacteroidetes bacterium]|nr:MAG: hypothetical protein C5B52_14325 [Bacteroidota bacterium]